MTHRVLWSNVSVLTTDQIANTTTETTFGSQSALPANTDSLTNSGRTFRLQGFLALSTAAASAGALTLRVKWGASNLSTSAPIALPTGLSNSGGRFDCFIQICATGSAGKVSCQGFGLFDNAGAALTFTWVNPGTGVSGQSTINTQLAANLGISAQFSVASPSNIITLTDLIIEELA
jgi:hypothetical protein